ncbi:MAG: hypothetical protein IJW48_04115 [Clostridia bacterium]|nr:hypothetical protein [Clostridia bacterium]
MIHTIKSEKLTVLIDDMGAELVSVRGSDGYEYIWDGKEHWHHHAPVFFPTCGRIVGDTYTLGGKTYNMGIHGFASKSHFSAVHKSDSRLTLSTKETEATKAMYPFEFEFIADFEVADDVLSVSFTVCNNSARVMPYMVGWHPGFTLDSKGGSGVEDWSLRFDTRENLVSYPITPACFVSHEGIDYPVKDGTYVLNEREIYDNDSVLFSNMGCRAVLSARGEAHSLIFDWSENLPYFCIWKAPTSDAMFVCLEPWSNLPGDGREENFDTKEMSRLPSGGRETYTYRLKFQ